MLIEIDTLSEIPLYIQIKNEIVLGIGRGQLSVGESLPTVREMAKEAGINTMTVQKAYNLLKNKGYIEIDRRQGAKVSDIRSNKMEYESKLRKSLELILIEAEFNGMDKKSALDICTEVINKININRS
ncbi:GntR family transcriptional regulator [Clostridium sp. MSJ-8]|uniref:GntR family transcriptional regulator n=1 Tax=Clostridium sp. MSJ-8 TaxID=2841510 RepID=UPI001C0F14D1|nr:GntR family transcriptional regulator [Clostridium sp. MSJ-8]MBU5487064.1 GntR family transcriptional regulator [Clostridium sp. MSJ-8]